MPRLTPWATISRALRALATFFVCNVDYLYREFSYGTFRRILTLPEGVETEKINAECNSGLVEITAPMAAAALPRRVEIKGLPKAKAG